ncbi:MAG: hypothetical protein K5656_01765 [Lachnospiraceae bacterium]|nr:hypothetical protein [Lachnospiraceae bacterium]
MKGTTTMKIYVVIYTDFGDTCDGFARVLGTYPTKEEAKKEIERDIFTYDKNGEYERTVDQDDRVLLGDEEDGCQWQILKIESEVNNETKIKKAKSNSS